MRVDEVGSLAPAGCVVPAGVATTTPPTPWWPPVTSRCVGYRRACFPSPAGSGPPRASPVPTTPFWPSTPPTPEGSWAPAPGSLVPSMAFATGIQARLPLGPLARGFLTTLQASLDAADWPVARPLYGTVYLRFDPGLSPDAGSAATGDPGVSPGRTHTGWLP